MNSLYIGIGVAIILALVTALVGPYFVDWTQYRSVFEREGARIFGEQVTVLGAAQVRLLPMPSLSLQDVVIGPVDRPSLKIDRLDLKIEMTPLMKGDIRISELRLDRPTLRIGLDGKGTAFVPGLRGSLMADGSTEPNVRPDVGGVGLELAEIVDGRVLISDQRNGGDITIDGLNGTASATALTGPMKFDGGASFNGHPFSFRIGTGKRGDDGIWPVRIQVSPVEEPYQLSIEAALDATPAALKASGTLSLQRLALSEGKSDKYDMQQPTPWQVEASFVADPQRIILDMLQLSVGDADRATTITGKGAIDLGARPTFDLQLRAKQVDLDRLMAARIGDAADLSVAVGRLQSIIQSAPKLPLAGRARMSVVGVVLGGGAVQDVELDVRTRTDGWAIDAFEARLPGRSRITGSGRLVVADSPTFEGQLSLASDQPAALLQWWKKGPIAPIDPFQFAGRVMLAAGSLRVDELTARLGTARARGALQWLAAHDAIAAHLKTVLSADQLDLDQARVIVGLVSDSLGVVATPRPGAATDTAVPKGLASIDLDLDAGTVLVSGQALKGVTVKAAFDGASLTIDRLSIRDAIGAAIDVKGRIERLTTVPDGAIDGSIRAERMVGLAKLVESLSPGSAWAKRLVLAAPAMQPFNATARLTGVAGTETSDVHLTLDGTAAVSRLGLDARFNGRFDRFRQGNIDAVLKLDGPDGGLVLRQIGIPAMSDKASTGKLLVSVKGVPDTGVSLTANADLAGSRLLINGRASLDEADIAHYDTDASLTTTDLRVLATLFGQAVPSGGATVPLDLKTRIEGTGLKARIGPLSGRLAEVGVTGSATLDVGQSPARLDGTAQVTLADLSTVLELGLGADALQAPAAKGSVWPTDVLAGPLIGFLNANIDLAADRLTIDPAGGPQARGIDRFKVKLRLRPGQVLLDEVKGSFAGGDMTGALGLKAGDGGEIKLTGNTQIKGARLADVVWRRDGRAVADGAMDLAVTYDASGRSIAALAANLTGTGALTITDGLMRYVDPDAFGAIISAADGGLELKPDKIRTVFQGRLDAGTLPFQRVEAAFAINAGVLRVRDVNVTSTRAKTSGSVALDFGRWTMDADWTLKVDPGRNGVVGAEPQVGVLFRGPLDQPQRTLDVSPLSAFLTLRAFEREVQRVEDLQQDMVERDRFQRELRRLKYERQRSELWAKATEAAEKARIAEDAKKAEEAKKADEARKVEDARKAEEARKAAEAVKPAPAPEPLAVPPAPPKTDDPPKATDTPPAPTITAPVPASPSDVAPPASPPRSPEETQSITPRSVSPVRAAPPSPMPRQVRPEALPNLPPIIFINPQPPVMPLEVPVSPSAQ